MDAMQRYVSKELTHFVGGNLRKEIDDKKQLLDAQYNVLLTIIKEKRISYDLKIRQPLERGLKYASRRCYKFDRRNKFSDNNMINPCMVCFCDIPIGDLAIHIGKFSPFGLSFKKSFLIERGANPVFYVEKNSAITYCRNSNFGNYIQLKNLTRSEYFDELVNLYAEYCYDFTHMKCGSSNPSQRDECHDIGYFLLDLLCYVKFFDASKPDDSEENFYMEREWRTPYEVHFEISNICRIILPSTYSERFRRDVPEYVGQITFSDEYFSSADRPKIE